MKVAQTSILVSTSGQGTYEVTPKVETFLRDSGLREGMLHVFCRHTSCSLLLMENADPSARQDLEGYFRRLAPDDDPHFTHTAEGADDMPSHIKMALTRSSEAIPFREGRLLLGTWQGIFLFEHRYRPHHRSLALTAMGTPA